VSIAPVTDAPFGRDLAQQRSMIQARHMAERYAYDDEIMAAVVWRIAAWLMVVGKSTSLYCTSSPSAIAGKAPNLELRLQRTDSQAIQPRFVVS
jgi:hypothetical protein